MARYAYKKHYTWTADLAYLTGLMTSDGCLSKDGRHLNITSKDSEIIDSFRKVLQINSLPRSKLGGFNTTALDLQFGDVALYDFLLKVGLTPAKSLTIEELNIPDLWYPDFLRGHFDGDGTLYGYYDRRWPKSYMFYVQFTSASIPFLKWLHQTNKRLFGLDKGAIKQGRRAWILSYAKSDSRRLFRAMYADPMSLKLSRKYDKFVAFLEVDTYAVGSKRARVL